MDNKIFRVSMILYSETKGIKNKNVILKKVIESVFVDNNNSLISTSEVVDNIHSIYNTSIVEDEIIGIINDEKNKKHFCIEMINGEQRVQLEDNRYNYLKEKCAKNIGEYIEEFSEMKNVSDEMKKAVYRYLYNLYNNGIDEFEAVLTGKSKITEEEGEKKFSNEEVKFIDSFLQWKNEDKNKSLMALLGFSLEYSMLTCSVDSLYGSRLGDIFSNKTIYIDTNIIYYCLGINGTEYKKANDRLLTMCNKCGEKLFITKATDNEFRNTLDHYINEIKKYESPSINNLKFSKYMQNQDIYLYYLEWKKNKNIYKDVKYFKNHILDQYRKWLKDYGITIDKNKPFKDNDRFFKEYSEEISYDGKINYDAMNITWIEKRREENGHRGTSFSDNNYYLLSADRNLQRWDSQRKTDSNIVVSPKTWMLLLNKFVSRSDNDYESFISFINIRVPSELPINNKEFYIIVKEIEKVTSDINQQESIIDTLVEENFSYLFDEDMDEDIEEEVVEEKTYKEAERIMETKVQNLQKTVDEMVKKQDIINQNQMRYQQKDQERKQALSDKEKLQKEKDFFIQDEVNKKLRNKRIRHAILITFITVIVLWQIIDIFVRKNMDCIFISLIRNGIEKTVFKKDELPNYILQIGGGVLAVIIGFVIKPLAKIFYKRDLIEAYKNKKRTDIEKRIEERTE